MKRIIPFVTILVLLSSMCDLLASETNRVFALDAVVDSPDSRAVMIPTGVAAGSDSELAVTDAQGNRLVIFKFSGTEWTASQTIRLPASPLAIAHDGRRYLVSMRDGHGLIAVEGLNNALRPVALPTGAVSGPVASLPGGGFLVYNTVDYQVLQYDPAGAVEKALAAEPDAAGLAASRDGGYFLTLPSRGEILRYDAAGTIADRWKVPAVDPVPAWPVGLGQLGGELLVLDRHGHRLVLFDSKNEVKGIGGRRGWEPGLLLFPSAMTVFPDGRVAVADQLNGRVQIYRRVEE